MWVSLQIWEGRKHTVSICTHKHAAGQPSVVTVAKKQRRVGPAPQVGKPQWHAAVLEAPVACILYNWTCLQHLLDVLLWLNWIWVEELWQWAAPGSQFKLAVTLKMSAECVFFNRSSYIQTFFFLRFSLISMCLELAINLDWSIKQYVAK